MRGCRQFGSEVAAFLDRELDARETAAFEAHLDDCGACRSALEATRDLEASLRALPPIEPGPRFEAQFWARLARAESARDWRERLRSWQPLQWLGAATAVATLAVLLSVGHPAPSAQDWILITGDDFDLVLETDPQMLASLDLLDTWDEAEEI